MDEAVMRQHIQLYVNEYSEDLGPAGEEAIRVLFRKAHEAGLMRIWTWTDFLLAAACLFRQDKYFRQVASQAIIIEAIANYEVIGGSQTDVVGGQLVGARIRLGQQRENLGRMRGPSA
jgi:hypothetical protein